MTILFIAAVVILQVEAVGLLLLPLIGGEFFYGAVSASARRCREEGLTVATLTPDVGYMMRDRYGITNRGVILNQVHVETLTEFIEAARESGVVYATSTELCFMGRLDLMTYSPVVVTRMWPYTVEWVNQ